MADWDKMALMNVMIGFEAEILGIITYHVTPNWPRSHSIQGLLIVAFVLYAFGAAMMAASKMNGAIVNIVVSILVMICMFVTGRCRFYRPKTVTITNKQPKDLYFAEIDTNERLSLTHIPPL